MSMGSILGIFEANRKSRSMKTVMSNLNLALESMSKEMRYGHTYHCGAAGTLSAPLSCPGGDNFIAFIMSDANSMYYRLNNGAIERYLGGSGGFVPITAPEVTIETLTFYVTGTGTGNTLQPKVNILVRGRAGAGGEQSSFTLQTLVSQRKLDID